MNSNEFSEGFEAFKVYNAIRLHFTTEYDFFKYNGKTRVTEKSWAARQDRFFFKKIERSIGIENLVPFFVSNYIDRDTLWSKDLIGTRAKNHYKLFNKEEHYNTFRGDLAYLISLYKNTDDLLNAPQMSHPNLLKAYIIKSISPITMIILQSLVKYSNMWNATIVSDPQWSAVRSYLGKLNEFVIFDRQKCLEKYKEFPLTETLIYNKIQIV